MVIHELVFVGRVVAMGAQPSTVNMQDPTFTMPVPSDKGIYCSVHIRHCARCSLLIVNCRALYPQHCCPRRS